MFTNLPASKCPCSPLLGWDNFKNRENRQSNCSNFLDRDLLGLSVFVMTKASFLIMCLFMPVSVIAQKLTLENIPNSDLEVTFPSDWNHSRPYVGKGEIQLSSDLSSKGRAWGLSGLSGVYL